MSLQESFATHRARIALLARYVVSGALGGALQTLIFYVWVSLLGLEAHYVWGVVIGFCAGAVLGFLLQKYWTFNAAEHAHPLRRQFVLYITIGLCGLALNALLIAASKILLESWGFNFFHVWYLIAQLCIIALVALLSFIANYFFTFRAKKEEVSLR